MSSSQEGGEHRPIRHGLPKLALNHLEIALKEDELSEKHYRIRSALQYLVIFEEEYHQ